MQVCEVQASRGGIECALTNHKQIFFKWSDLKEKFLPAFDHQIIVPQDGFQTLVEKGHKK